MSSLRKQDMYVYKCAGCNTWRTVSGISPAEQVKRFKENIIITDHIRAVWFDSKVMLFKRFITLIENIKDRGRLLDIGCGYGVFLKIAKDRGWDVTGIEIASMAASYAADKLKLRIIQAPLR